MPLMKGLSRLPISILGDFIRRFRKRILKNFRKGTGMEIWKKKI